MANYFRTTSSMLARIETLTKELLGATPYGELNDGLGVFVGHYQAAGARDAVQGYSTRKISDARKAGRHAASRDAGNRQRDAHAVQNQQRASPRVRDFACQRRPFCWHAGARSFSGPHKKTNTRTRRLHRKRGHGINGPK